MYRTLIKHYPNGSVFLFDRDLRYTLVDGQGLAAVGLSKEQLEGKTLWEVLRHLKIGHFLKLNL